MSDGENRVAAAADRVIAEYRAAMESFTRIIAAMERIKEIDLPEPFRSKVASQLNDFARTARDRFHKSIAQTPKLIATVEGFERIAAAEKR